MSNRWKGPGGYRHVLNVSLPLVVSMGSLTLMLFTDRLFLSRYSIDTISAALPAGIASFLFICFFMGIAGYLNVFVAQYTGAGTKEKVGTSLWQGVYFSAGAYVVLASLFWIAEPLFSLAGHSPEVRRLEVTYFRVLMLGAGASVLGPALASFFSGRGLTRVVMITNLMGAAINIPLDYCLINGIGPFPELGILGAGIATVSAHTSIALILAILIFNKKNDREFGVISHRGFDRDLFLRLMRFGLPNGIQFFIDLFAFTAFVFLVGRIGKEALAATNRVFSISTLAFLPMIGFGMGVSILVGQALGRNRPWEAETATRSTVHITFCYMLSVAAVFVMAPEWLLDLFRTRVHTTDNYEDIIERGVILLRFVAFYSLFDTLFIVYSSAIKGAGDTSFVMWSSGILSFGIMIIPVYIAVVHLGAGLYVTWSAITAYICLAGLLFRWRYFQGKWKEMRVIERHSPVIES
ncbi:MAG: MATE family efflux transporter [Deltaproteobacteria bacterium]|nr:MATE family efflux transporter [Deltaproteobacteria bacterium]